MVSRWIRCASTALIGSVLFCGAALSAPPVKNTPPTVTLTSPASGALYSSPASITLSANATDANGTISKIDFFRGSTLIASVATAPYSFVWSNVAAGSYSITAKATDNGGATATSNAAAITVSSAPAASIVITSPVAGSSVNQLVDVAGTFSGAADTTVLVYNGNNNTVLGIVTGNEFLAKNVPLAPGNNTITATSVRRDGLSATTLVPVTVPYLLAVLTSPPKNGVHDLPASLTFQASAVVANGSIQRVEYYSGANLLGSAVTAPYNFVWSNPTIGSHSLYARVVDNAGLSQSSNAVNVTVRGLNQLPIVSLTAPISGAVFSSPASFTLQAAATDSDGTIASVEFLQNGAFLGATNIAPYRIALSNIAQGSYTLTARATDNRGGVAVSSPVNVTVTRPNNSPAVNLTSPQVNASYIAPASVALSATATDSDGTVTRVEFYAGNVLVATATTAPYTATWAVSTPGSYSITAKAYDDLGASTVSSAVAVTVGDGVTYLHNDFAGNPIAATDSSGTVMWKENFRPYGDRLNNQAAAAENRLGFHGKAVDTETGLSYFGARYYDPTLGRFMGIDPVGFVSGSIYSFNRYAYGNNNPYKYRDPDGKSPVLIGRVVFAASFEAATAFGAAKLGFWLAEKAWSATHNESAQSPSDPKPEKVNGNSKDSPNPQHGYEIEDGQTGGRVKTGVSGGPLNPDGSTPRGKKQADAWNREPGNEGRYKPEVVVQVPGGKGARGAILDWERQNAQDLRNSGQLDPNRHTRP